MERPVGRPKVLTGLVLLALFVLFLWMARRILPPFIIALALASLLNPPLERLHKRGMSRGKSVAIVYAAFFLIAVAVLTWLVPLLLSEAQALAENWPAYVKSFKSLWDNFVASDIARWLPFAVPETWSDLTNTVSDYAARRGAQLISGAMGGVFGTIGYILNIFIVLIATFYMLSDWPRIRRRFQYVIPPQYRENVLDVGEQVGQVFIGYLRGLMTLCLMYGAAVTVVLLLLDLAPGVDTSYQFILGLAAALLYAVPYIGAALLAATAALVTFMAGGGGYLSPLLVAGSILTLNSAVFDPILTPKVLGKSTGLSPLVSLFALMAGSSLMGVAGFILGVPVAASIAIIASSLYPRLAEDIPENANVAPDEAPPGEDQDEETLVEEASERAHDAGN